MIEVTVNQSKAGIANSNVTQIIVIIVARSRKGAVYGWHDYLRDVR